MGTIWVREFTGGLDNRRMAVTSAGNTLIEAEDVHITRGGEIEKRAAFVPSFVLPDATVGLAYDKNGLVTFGSGPQPEFMPSGVRYQRLDYFSELLVAVISTELFAGKLYVVAEFANDQRVHFYDGVRVETWDDGKARVAFQVTSAEPGSTVSGININGVGILRRSVFSESSLSATADAIAAEINDFTATSGYTATTFGDRVNIIARDTSPTPNGYGLYVVGSEGFNIVAPYPYMSGGRDPASVYEPGSFVKTIGDKVYSVSGPNTHFSGIQRPTVWTTDAAGAGFIDMSSQSSGAEELTALAKYQGYVAVFAERLIQIWYFDPDPTLNKQAQVLNNTGTGYPKSVTQFGDNDLFYLSDSGLRSLRARDSSNSAATTDIGSPVDEAVNAARRALPAASRAKIVGVIEPQDGRFWLIMADRIFVFSYFSGAQVSAWSTYAPSYFDENGTRVPFTVDEALVFRQHVYLRSGNRIFVYGGLDQEPAFDETPARVRLPFLDADTPTRKKKLMGVDAAVEGDWRVYASLDPNEPGARDQIGTLSETTYNIDRIPAQGEATHLSVTLETVGAGPRRLGSLVIHYEADADED